MSKHHDAIMMAGRGFVKLTPNAEVSGAGTASAGLPGSATTQEE